MTEQELLVDSLQRLNRLGLPYMLTGSMASNFWGVPRTTHDIDFVLAFERREAADIAAMLEDGFFVEERAIVDALDRPYMFNAIDRRSALKIDFWTLRREGFEQEMFAPSAWVSGTLVFPRWFTCCADLAAVEAPGQRSR